MEMIDIYAFLRKSDYTNDELQDLISKLESYVEFLGSYEVSLYKTTKNAVYTREKYIWEIPHEIIENEMSSELVEYFDKYVSCAQVNMLEAMLLTDEDDRYELMLEELQEITKSYFAGKDGHKRIFFSPNQYAIKAYMNSGMGDTFKELIEEMGFECSQVLQVYNGGFAKDSFVYIPTTKSPPKNETYLFWLDKHYSEKSIKTICERLTSDFDSLRYGIYTKDSNIAVYVKEADISYIERKTIKNEYEKYIDYQDELHQKEKEIIKDKEKWEQLRKINEEKIAEYYNSHNLFEEFHVSKGQQALWIHMVRDDYDAVKKILQNAGLNIAHESIETEETINYENTHDIQWFIPDDEDDF